MSDQYYRFFPGDYIRDTQRLSLLEHGAYRVLLDSYYCEEFLPSDRESLYHICRAFKKDEKKEQEESGDPLKPGEENPEYPLSNSRTPQRP